MVGDRVSVDTKTLESFFDSVEIESDYLKNILERVLTVIDNPNLYFGNIHEGRIFGVLPAAVTWDGEIYLDPVKLKFYEDDVLMAIIAHELAHHHLKHYELREDRLELHIEADELARSWGFNVDKLRRVLPINGEET